MQERNVGNLRSDAEALLASIEGSLSLLRLHDQYRDDVDEIHRAVGEIRAILRDPR